MQLYKSRDFSEFFQDTFTFLKLNGKHYFQHFFLVNGVFILILMVFGYFFTKFYSEVLFGNISPVHDSTVIEDYINNNGPMFFLIVFLFVVLALISGIISYSYTPIYLKLYAEKDGKNFFTKDIVDMYKENVGSIFIFLIASVFVGIILILPLALILVILAVTLIGILLIPFALSAFALFFSCTLMEYLEGRRSIMESYSYAWQLMSSKFVAAIGSVGLFYLMSYIIQNIVTMIPYIFGMISFFTTIESSGTPDAEEVSSFVTLMMLLVFFLSFLLGIILSTIVQLNQGIVFYSLKEDNENINTKSEIDLIGSGE